MSTNEDIFLPYYLKVITGREFNELFSHHTFIKLTNETENHNTFQFHDGLNVDIIEFNPKGECNPGGIYFTEFEKAHMWLYYSTNYMKYIREVIIPDDACVYVEKDKFKANKIFLCLKKEIDIDLYIKGINKNTYLCCLNLLPDSLKTKEICLKSIKLHSGTFHTLHRVPIKLRDKEICMENARKCGGIYNVPIEILDKELCIEAVKYNYNALYDIPSTILDKDICMIAVRHFNIGLSHIPTRFRDKDICMVVLKRDKYSLAHVPSDILDKELCLIAVKNNNNALQYVPLEFRDHEVCEVAIKHDYVGNYEDVPSKFK